MKKRYTHIVYIKAIAALLILNSHYDSIYPISALATGGAIGNALFFASSGFLLEPIEKKFKEWFFPKWVKVYIPTLVFSAIYLCTVKRQLITDISIKNIISIFVWPTLFWFIGAILLFYFLFYLLKDIKKKEHFRYVSIALIILYFIYYIVFIDKTTWSIEEKGLSTVGGYFKLIYYFAAMLLGKYIRIQSERLRVIKGDNGIIKYTVLSIFSFSSVYLVKYIINKISSLMFLQFLNQFSILLLVYSLFCLGLCYEYQLTKNTNRKIYKVCTIISKITLYLYLTQFLIIELVEGFIFPINFIVATIAIFLTSYATSILFDWIFVKTKIK